MRISSETTPLHATIAKVRSKIPTTQFLRKLLETYCPDIVHLTIGI